MKCYSTEARALAERNREHTHIKTPHIVCARLIDQTLRNFESWNKLHRFTGKFRWKSTIKVISEH